LEIDDFPLFNWEKCEGGELRYVNKDSKSRKSDFIAWNLLFNQYLERFGLGELMSEYLDVKAFLTELRLLYIETGNRMLLNQIKIEEARLKKLDPSAHEGMTIDQSLVYLSRWMGGGMLNKRKITIVEFKNLMNEYARSNKKERLNKG